MMLVRRTLRGFMTEPGRRRLAEVARTGSPSSTAGLQFGWLAVGLLLVTLGTGCRLIRGVADVPGQAVRTVAPGERKSVAPDPVYVQQALLRFADEFSTRMTLSIDDLRRGTNALDRAEALQWTIALNTQTWSIATGLNPVANLLDMTVFVSVVRAALEDYWLPNVFGESARRMLDGCRESETIIWRFAGQVLNPEQQAELRDAIVVWRRKNLAPETMLSARAVGFASQVAMANRVDTARPGSVFNLLIPDPFSGLNPATREIAQARMFAERALYLTQKLPRLLRWQAELLSINTMTMPAVGQLVTNSTQLAAAAERFARVAEELPQQLRTEREAIFKALEAQETSLAPLVGDVRQTLVAGSQMSTSLNTTITTFDSLMKRFGVGESNAAGPPDTNAVPFRIQDYGQTAGQLEAMARQLNTLLLTLDQTLGSTNLAKLSAQVGPAVQQAQTSGKEVVDYAFWRGVGLVVIGLIAALVYRLLVARLTSATPPKKDSR